MRQAEKLMPRFAGPGASYRFVTGDAHELIKTFSPGEFDTILCLGFFYHTAHHFALLQEIARLKPRCFIMDTKIVLNPGKVVVYMLEDTGGPKRAASEEPFCWVGFMSRPLLDESLKSYGFEYSFFDWDKLIRNLQVPCPDIQDYVRGVRVTVHATRRQDS